MQEAGHLNKSIRSELCKRQKRAKRISFTDISTATSAIFKFITSAVLDCPLVNPANVYIYSFLVDSQAKRKNFEYKIVHVSRETK